MTEAYYQGHWVFSAHEATVDAARQKRREIRAILGKDVELAYDGADRKGNPVVIRASHSPYKILFNLYSRSVNPLIYTEKVELEGRLYYELDPISYFDLDQAQTDELVGQAAPEAIRAARAINERVWVRCLNSTISCNPSDFLPEDRQQRQPHRQP